ncbi:carbohydrate ABC transporter permease [Chitinivibrio alkaliphilus]|uniref:ABC-type transport system, permease component n=1 Tax=Chitinivibrio alkaliphilus ACht1 TaxID=1313304 RepID=U7D903_9BACT|nr:sugar ABC transporter permease [Chitinivibrio alkaliphilus]ERP31582.1 ABC-type transport system, permease component [Chitinivibrio alkaliphilus ACht1]
MIQIASLLKGKLIDIWPLLPAAIYLFTSLVLVIVYLLKLAFTHRGVFPSLTPVQQVLQDPEFSDALINSLFFVLVGTPTELCIGILLALLIYTAPVLRSTLRSFFILPMAFPGLVIASLFFILFNSQGGMVNDLLMGRYDFFPAIIETDINWSGNRWFSLILSMMGKVWRDMPLSMLIILSGLNAVDVSIFDAAKTLGAGFRHRLLFIVIPLIFPAIKTVILLRSIEMWKEFIFPYVLSGRYYLLGTLVEHYYNGFSGQPEKGSVVALILLVCVILSLFTLLFLLQNIEKRLINRGSDASAA